MAIKHIALLFVQIQSGNQLSTKQIRIVELLWVEKNKCAKKYPNSPVLCDKDLAQTEFSEEIKDRLHGCLISHGDGGL